MERRDGGPLSLVKSPHKNLTRRANSPKLSLVYRIVDRLGKRSAKAAIR